MKFKVGQKVVVLRSDSTGGHKGYVKGHVYIISRIGPKPTRFVFTTNGNGWLPRYFKSYISFINYYV